MDGGPSYNAITAIKVSRFLVLTGNANREVAQAAGNSAAIVGISDKSPDSPENPDKMEQYELGRTAGGGGGSAYEAYAANGSASNPVPVNAHTAPNRVVALMAGGTINEGDTLTSDSDGRGVATTTTGHFYGARALHAAVVGELVEVEIERGRL